MPNIRFRGYWALEYQESLNVPKGFIVLKYQDFYRKNIGKIMMKLDAYQKKKFNKAAEKAKNENGEISDKDFMRELIVDISFSYNKATLDQKALIWSLYKIEANEQNGGMSGAKKQMVTEMELYMNDLDDPTIGEREIINTSRYNLGTYIEEYRIIEAVILDNGKELTLPEYQKIPAFDDDRITIRVVRGLSKMNTVQAAKLADRIFNRLSYHGVAVTNPGEIEDYWKKWRQFLNDEKITIHDAIMTREEYKALTPICEACGQHIAEGEGNLCHIKSIGMGGDRTKEPKKNYTSNWLHMHEQPCHLVHWHQDGIKAFLKKYSHLMYKVNTAMSREYKPINDHEQLFFDESVESSKEDEKLQGTLEILPNKGGLKESAMLKTCDECGEKHNEELCPKCKGQGLF